MAAAGTTILIVDMTINTEPEDETEFQLFLFFIFYFYKCPSLVWWLGLDWLESKLVLMSLTPLDEIYKTQYICWIVVQFNKFFHDP